jgi:large subunit ribosomal protein L6
MPVEIPSGVTVRVDGNRVNVSGPKGELSRAFPTELSIASDGKVVQFSRSSDEPRQRALHGLARALLNNMVVGVSRGFSRELQVEGVGYRPELDGGALVLHVGYSHPVRVAAPPGISFDVDAKARQIRITGSDKELVGQVAADIRKIRPPEPYKGKGIRYVGEHVRHKAGKAGKVT